MNPLAKLQNLVGMFLEILQSNDPLADAPKTGPALLLSDCGLGDTPVDDEWKPSVHDDQGEALEPAPRTVNSLGPDERDARWVSGVGTQWKWDNGRWWHTEPYGVAGIWIAAPYGYTPNASSPYTEATAQPLSSADKLSADELAEAAECISRLSTGCSDSERSRLEKLRQRFVQAADVAADAGPLLW